MILKSSKNNSIYIIAIGIIAIVLLLTVNYFKKLKEKKKLVVQQIEQKTNLQSLQITLKEKHYKKLKKKRDKDYAIGVMESEDSDYVPAIITYAGSNYKATIRLKGDWTDHLEGEKWSFRIKLKGNKTILGMRKFSIHHPKTRGYINEWLFHKVHKQEGLMGLRYGFAEGFLHIKQTNQDEYINKNLGIYAIEEAIDKRTIESNQRKEGVILRFSEKNYWKEVKAGHYVQNQNGYLFTNALSPNFNMSISGHITTFGLGRILKDDILQKQFILAKGLLNRLSNDKLTISKVFDINKLAKHVALTNLFGARHGFSQINLRFYYNPTTSLFEPISSDGNSGYATKFRHYYKANGETDLKYAKALIHELEIVSDSTYLEKLFKTYQNDIDYYESELKKEFFSKAPINKDNYKKNQLTIKKELVRLKKILDKKTKQP